MPDREKVIKGLKFCCGTGMCFDGCPYHEVSQNIDECTSQLALEALELLKEQPEIVRCRDCKHSEHWYGDKQRCFLWDENGIDVFEDGFCSYGKRGTDDA